MAVLAQAQITISRIVDIASVTRYYLLQSSTASTPSKPTANPPGGNWVTTEPSYTTGSTNSLYFVDLTLFTNNTFSYSAVSKSSSYEAAKAAYNKAVNAESTANSAQEDIDNLEIGGRNLLLDTNFIKPRDNTATTVAQTSCLVDESHYENIKGKTLTLSCYIHSPGNRDTSLESSESMANRFGMHGLIEWSDSTGTNTSNKTVYPFTDLLNQVKEYCRISSTYTVTPPDGYDTIAKVSVSVQTYAKPASGNSEIWLLGLPKLEYGNRSTDWTPAPEDVDSDISDAQNTADEAQNTADNNSTRLTGAESTIQQLVDRISMIVTDENGTSLLDQTSEGWSFNLYDVGSGLSATQEALGDLTDSLGSTDAAIEVLKDAVSGIGDKTAYINIGTDDDGDPCLELGKIGNDFKVRITNIAVDFLEGSSKIAYINNNSLYITKAVVTESLDITPFVLGCRSNGNFSLQYKGGNS